MVVRPMRLEEVDLRIDYFHDASDEYLEHLGADRARMPSRDAWRAYYAEDFARPLAERETYNLIWEVDGRAIGFSSVDHITFGEEMAPSTLNFPQPITRWVLERPDAQAAGLIS
ncbi:MAG TPA: hypothetical protein VGC32_22110 [Solirubrobacterales bacterium]